MIKIQSSKLGVYKLDKEQNLWVYCGLDNCLTKEIYNILNPLLDPDTTRKVYEFEKALCGPAMTMMRRGFRVDAAAVKLAIEGDPSATYTLDECGEGKKYANSKAAKLEVQKRKDGLLKRLSRLGGMAKGDKGKWAVVDEGADLQVYAKAIFGKPFNYHSPKQLQTLLYDALNIPAVTEVKDNKVKVLTNHEALMQVAGVFPRAKPICNLLFRLREIEKLLDVLTKGLDADGRMRCSFNVAGTECVAGDTLVLTASGIRTMEDIYNASRTSLWSDGWVKPVRKVKYENVEGLEITLLDGRKLRCSKNHPLLTNHGWREAQHIRVDIDKLQDYGTGIWFGQTFTPYSANTPAEFYELLGMLLADGTLHTANGGYSIRISNSDPSVLQRFGVLISILFPEETPRLYKDSAHVSCRALYDILAPSWQLAGAKYIPAWAMRGTPPLLRALLRGLTLDSHITEKGLNFGTVSGKLRTQIQVILRYLKIPAIQTNRRLRINNRYIGDFIYQCGFVQQSKLLQCSTQINNIRQVSFDKDFNTVVKIIPWVGDVYDCTMPEYKKPQYSAMGICSHNTGRWSSSSSVWGTGGNMQNITPELRGVFVPDPGYILCNADLSQAESRCVAYLSGDEKYIEACESADLHTTIASMLFGIENKREVAEGTPWFRHFSCRDMAKRAGHALNYGLSPTSLSRHMHIPMLQAWKVYLLYLGGEMTTVRAANLGLYSMPNKEKDGKWLRFTPTFPGIKKWHDDTIQELELNGVLTTPLGRRRTFWGRLTDSGTHREAIAYRPQSMIGDMLNSALLKVWARLEPEVQLLGQVHDSIVFQVPEKKVDEFAPIVLECLRNPVAVNGRTMVIPSDFKVGKNWRDMEKYDSSK